MAKRTGEKYQAILSAAVKSFALAGYHRTRVTDIARRAGVADGTVYIYFSSKKDILISLFQNLMNTFVDNLKDELSHCQNATEKLSTIISYHLKTLYANPDQAKVTQIELRQIDPSINRGISEPLKNYFALIEEVVEEGKTEGFFRQDLDKKIARKVIFGAIDEVVTCWAMSGKPYNLVAHGKPVFHLLIKGL